MGGGGSAVHTKKANSADEVFDLLNLYILNIYTYLVWWTTFLLLFSRIREKDAMR
jgi:hypothetical protein